ncbi:MAG: SRPBCC domain-containing protein [Halioglobus sp.]
MTATAENGWTLSITRHIAAPPPVVWQVMTQRTAEWWCPRPWTTEIVAQEWRAGGRHAIVMHGPNGETSGGEGIFLEVTPAERIVFTDAISRADGGWMPQESFMIGCFELSAEAGGTRYRAWSRHWNEAACRRHEEMGFSEGWKVVADQLATLAEGGTID